MILEEFKSYFSEQDTPEPEELRDVENDWGGVWVGY